MLQGASPGRVAHAGATSFITASLLGAALVFMVQPMFARMATPLLGGAPAVWNVSLVCFQAALLAGYAYAHLLTRLASTRLQVGIHAAVLLAGLACLPLRLSGLMGEPNSATPVGWLVGTFALSIAPPFAALSATAPLIQHWYARTGRPDAADPYHLYAASNIGSLVGLAAYPLVVEPFASLSSQSLGWTIGYIFLAATLLFAGVSTMKRPAPVALRPANPEAAQVPRISWRTRLRWLALAFVPSSLLLGITSHITTDIAAAPFLWAPPLVLYLLTFVFAFAKKPPIRHELALGLAPLAAAFAIATFFINGPGFFLIAMAADFAALFMLALACHGALSLNRPHTSHLTEFYLLMSLGGVLGGAFNALLAPLIFDSVVEFPLMLVAGIALLAFDRPNRINRLTTCLLAAAILALGTAVIASILGNPLPQGLSFALLLPAVAAIASSQKAPAAAAIAIALAAPIGWLLSPMHTVWSERSFFGVLKIEEAAGYRRLLHGTTMHGAQQTEGPDRLRPLTYYAAETPIAQAFTLYGDARSIAIVGLGVGGSACYAKPGQDWTFFEIDPLVVKIATDPAYFSYMNACQSNARIVLGDARISLSHTDAHFDLMLLDAFSSDSIPTHLLTVEAMQRYFDRLGEEGVLIVHISNRHLALAPVVARLASAVGAEAVLQNYVPSRQLYEQNVAATNAILVSRSHDKLERARTTGRWQDLHSDGSRPWTDDYSNIISAMLDRAMGK